MLGGGGGNVNYTQHYSNFSVVSSLKIVNNCLIIFVYAEIVNM